MTASSTERAARGARQRSSLTAAKIARGVVFLARDPLHARFLPPGAAESTERLGLEAGILKPWMCRLFDQPWYRRTVVGMTDTMWSGELMRLTLRKRFVDDEVRCAVAEGAGQLLIVGAGFDTVGLRVAASSPDVTVVELDTVPTADRRRAAVERLGETYPRHHIVGADLSRTSLRDVLQGIPSWDPDRSSVVLAEGVVMYLDEGKVRAFFEAIKGSTGTGSRVVFSYLAPDHHGRPRLGRLGAVTQVFLRLVGEPLRWAVSDGDLAPFLARCGYRLLGPPDRFDLRSRYLLPAGIDQPVGRMERFAVAESSGAEGIARPNSS